MIRTIAVMMLVSGLAAKALSSDLEETVVFRAGAEGYHTYRIPSLFATSKGTLLAFCEGRKEASGDSGNIDLLVKRSVDDGKTWSPLDVLWDDGDNTCGNPCPVVDERTGRIWLLLTWNLGSDGGRNLHDGKSDETRRVFKCHSDDDGATWTEPIEITDEVKPFEWWWYATGPGIGIQLKGEPHLDRLVVPCDHTVAGYYYGSHVIYSDDGGASWHASGTVQPACNECQVVELADGRLMLNMRTQDTSGKGPRAARPRNGYRSIAYSSDGGETWSDPVFDEHLGDPACQASLIRFSLASESDRDRLLFSNPSPTISPARGERHRMTVRMSYDEGRTWPVGKLVHEGPAAYSCLARLANGQVGLLYEAGERRAYETITFARFGLDWLTDGADHGPESAR